MAGLEVESGRKLDFIDTCARSGGGICSVRYLKRVKKCGSHQPPIEMTHVKPWPGLESHF